MKSRPEVWKTPALPLSYKCLIMALSEGLEPPCIQLAFSCLEDRRHTTALKRTTPIYIIKFEKSTSFFQSFNIIKNLTSDLIVNRPPYFTIDLKLNIDVYVITTNVNIGDTENFISKVFHTAVLARNETLFELIVYVYLR